MTPKRASLLGLPAELRNHVLEEALKLQTTWSEYYIDETSHQQPAILRACRQLRADGLEMFLQMHTFVIEASDLKVEPHPGHWIFNSKDLDHVYIRFDGSFSKSNLMEWVHRYFNDLDSFRFKQGDEAQEWEEMVIKLFDLVYVIALDYNSWDMVKHAVEAFMMGVEAGTQESDNPFKWDD